MSKPLYLEKWKISEIQSPWHEKMKLFSIRNEEGEERAGVYFNVENGDSRTGAMLIAIRILECVNECAGMANPPEAFKSFVKAVDLNSELAKDVSELKAQRDELLAAFSRIYQTSNHEGSHFQLAKEMLEKSGYDLITGKPHETPPQP